MSVLVVGSVALDSVETPQAKHDEILGGAASYFACVASTLVPVRLVAVVGEDFPAEHVEFLRDRGIDLAGLQHAAGRTFRWRGRYLPNMVDRETLDTQLNVFEQFRPTLPDAYCDTECVFLANIDPALQLQVLEQVKRPKLVACDTMNFWLEGQHRQNFLKVLERTDIAFFNDEEARMLSGQHSLVKAAAAIRLMGAKEVVIKRGDAGAMLFGEGGPFWAPAYPLEEVVDPTGAGDCFAGGVISYLAYTGERTAKSLRQAMVYGSVTASFAVEAFSVERLRDLTKPQITGRCDAFAKLVQFDRIEI